MLFLHKHTMKFQLLLTLACSLHVWDPVSGIGYKITGGFTEVTHGSYRTNVRQWGEYTTDYFNQGYIYHINGPKNYCLKDGMKTCQLKLCIATETYPKQLTYEFVGGRVVVKNIENREYVIDTINSWGASQAQKEWLDVTIHSGETWSVKEQKKGYGYMHVILKRSDRPSSTDTFSVTSESTENDHATEESFIGNKRPDIDSEPHTMCNFYYTSSAFGSDTSVHWQIYASPTKLISYDAKYGDSLPSGSAEYQLDTVSLSNNGHAIVGINLPIVGSVQEYSVQNTATFTTSFDFSISISASVDFPFGVSLGVETGFSFSSSQEFSETKTSLTSKHITFPNTSPVGVTVTFSVFSSSENQDIPVVFTFGRAGVTFTETATLAVKLSNIGIQSSACCLYEQASEYCGGIGLPLCAG